MKIITFLASLLLLLSFIVASASLLGVGYSLYESIVPLWVSYLSVFLIFIAIILRLLKKDNLTRGFLWAILPLFFILSTAFVDNLMGSQVNSEPINTTNNPMFSLDVAFKQAFSGLLAGIPFLSSTIYLLISFASKPKDMTDTKGLRT